jgi:ankyrin repeat protein
VDAIVAGDTEALARLLREQPDLVRARSGRTHRATLLHYLGANGVEPWRQRTPDNAAQIAAALLAAGADIEARANLYGGSSTTLGLLATSIHPKNARLLAPLLDLFLAHGARVDAGEGARSLVAACLANGRLEAAELLAARGAPLDLEAAAGLGRLDRVAGFFTATGALVPPATADQELAAFMWACEYGRTDVVEFLLDRGVDVSGRAGPHQQTGLHWAAHSGHVATVQALLRRRPGLEATDASFHGTPLAWAVHAWKERRNDPGRREPCYLVAELLVAAGAKAGAAGLDADEVRSDPRMLAILTRGREGAHPPKRGPRDRRGGSAP